MNLNIIVSHPGRQHVHQLVWGLQKAGYNTEFYTSVWFRPGKFPYVLLKSLPLKLRNKIERQFYKRYFEPLNGIVVHQFPVFEFIREIFENVFKIRLAFLNILAVNTIHDRYTAFFVRKENADIVIGYETACLNTFRKAKKNSLITVLDLAHVHYKETLRIRENYPDFDAAFTDKEFYVRENVIKEQELALADYILCLSDYVYTSLVENAVAPAKIYKLNLGFDPQKFEQKNTYKRKAKFRILYVGALTPKKGIKVLLEAIRKLSLDDVELFVVGNILNEYRHIFKGYEKYVTHIPFLSHDELVVQYQQADIFVCPSYLDSWAMVVLEAMACGTPVIVTENTGAKDAVIQGGGFIVPVNDVEAIREKIFFFYNQPENVEVYGKAAWQTAQKYTWDNYHEQLKTAMDDIWQKEQIKVTNKINV